MTAGNGLTVRATCSPTNAIGTRMLERIFPWFETRIDPFAPTKPSPRPPERLVPFFWYYLKPVWWAFALLTG